MDVFKFHFLYWITCEFRSTLFAPILKHYAYMKLRRLTEKLNYCRKHKKYSKCDLFLNPHKKEKRKKGEKKRQK